MIHHNGNDLKKMVRSKSLKMVKFAVLLTENGNVFVSLQINVFWLKSGVNVF